MKPESGVATNLGGILRVCRDLLKPIRGVAAGSGLSWDKAELLLELWRVADGIGDFKPDAEGFVTFNELRESLVNSQPYVSRRIKGVAAKDKQWVEVRESKAGEAHHANSHCVRISKQGMAVIKPVWQHLRELASDLFGGIPLTDRRVHLQVNQRMLHKIRAYRYEALQKSAPAGPLENIITTLKVRRELMTPRIEARLLDGTDLTLERADILVDLYGALKWDWSDPRADAEGFVTLKQLRASSVQGESSSQVLFSRRIRDLEGQGRIEIRKGKPDQTYLGENDRFRITEKGILVIAPVWNKYQELAEDLMEDIPLRMRLVHSQVNEKLLRKLQPPWARLF